MNLDFAALSGGPTMQPVRKLWEQAGTVGTQAFMRVPAFPGLGDRPGTSGDGGATALANTGTVADAGGFPSVSCPQVSPPSPHYPDARKPTEIKVSPVSPFVPSFGGMYASGTGFDCEAFEERAAIMEFDGGMTRADAEAAALALLAAAA